MSVRCSAPDVLPSTPGVMHVYSRRYTRITWGVMQGWWAACTLVSCYIVVCHVWYVCHIYVICFSQLYVMLLISFELTHIHTSCKSYIYRTATIICIITIICIVSVGSTVASGTQSLLTGAQLQPSYSRLSVLSLTSLHDSYGCYGPRWPPLGDPCYLI